MESIEYNEKKTCYSVSTQNLDSNSYEYIIDSNFAH